MNSRPESKFFKVRDRRGNIHAAVETWIVTTDKTLGGESEIRSSSRFQLVDGETLNPKGSDAFVGLISKEEYVRA